MKNLLHPCHRYIIGLLAAADSLLREHKIELRKWYHWYPTPPTSKGDSMFWFCHPTYCTIIPNLWIFGIQKSYSKKNSNNRIYHQNIQEYHPRVSTRWHRICFDSSCQTSGMAAIMKTFEMWAAEVPRNYPNIAECSDLKHRVKMGGFIKRFS